MTSVRIDVPPYGSTVPIASAPPHDERPPTYEDSTNPNALPPSYDSLYGEFRQVDNPRGLAQFMVKVLGIVVGTVAAAIVLGVLNIIPLAMIVVGAININNCPIERYIPIWLIVFGASCLFKTATNFFYRAKRSRSADGMQQQQQPQDNLNPNPFDGMLSCFLLVWFIVGAVWVYAVHDDVVYNPESANYCDQLTYQYSFVFITASLALLFIGAFCCCCCCCCICFKGGQQQRQPFN